MAKEQKRNFGDDIALQLRAARKKRWNVQEERRICQEIQLQTYLNKLINEDMENRIAKLKTDDTKNEDDTKREAADIEQECVRNDNIQSNVANAQILKPLSLLFLFQENHMTELNNLFVKIDDRRRVSAFPFHFIPNRCWTGTYVEVCDETVHQIV